jgi:hypothetical protein
VHPNAGRPVGCQNSGPSRATHRLAGEPNECTSLASVEGDASLFQLKDRCGRRRGEAPDRDVLRSTLARLPRPRCMPPWSRPQAGSPRSASCGRQGRRRRRASTRARSTRSVRSVTRPRRRPYNGATATRNDGSRLLLGARFRWYQVWAWARVSAASGCVGTASSGRPGGLSGSPRIRACRARRAVRLREGRSISGCVPCGTRTRSGSDGHG